VDRVAATRNLSLLPSTTEIAAALGLGEQLVGRSHECTVPPGVERLPVVTAPKLDPRAPSAAIDARVKALVRDGLSVYRVDADLARALAPDVLLTQTQCEVCAVTPSDLEAAASAWLAGREGPAPRLVAVAPNTLGDVLDDLVRVADGCGVAERGISLRAREWARIEAITARVDSFRSAAGSPPLPSVAFLEWLDPPMGPGSWIPELIERAGGRPVLGQRGEHAAWTDLDALAALDPDVLVLAPCGFDVARTRAELPPLANEPRFQALRAVRTGRVALVDAFLHMSRPGPRIAESLEILVELLHPAAPELDFGWRGRAWESLPRGTVRGPGPQRG
jgi:iron complex transport system substrate-binding protein